ncbi:MAG: hypothetical protein ACJ762_12135 [Solirubrobacteraceae bacterium]
MRLSRLPISLAAAVAVAFACAQMFPATSSSFTDTTASGGNTVTAVADWTAPTVSAVALQKAEGGDVNKFHSGETFYIYAGVADTGNPASGIGTITANTTNIATVTSAALTSGSWTVEGTTYNYRTALLTAKTLSSTTYTYSLSVSDTATNGPTAQSGSVVSSNVTFAPTTVLSTNVGTAGKVNSGDKIAFTYSSAPDPDALYPGWNGTSRAVTVSLADKAIYSQASDIIGIVDGSGNTTPLGYVLCGGDYINASTSTTIPATIALSGNVFTVTLGTPASSTNLRTDTGNRVASWYSYSTVFDTYGNASTAATIATTSRVQF